MNVKSNRSPITTHILDTQRGEPAKGVGVRLEHFVDPSWIEVAKGKTNEDGRLENLLALGSSLENGAYRLVFATGTYFLGFKIETFYPSISVEFTVSEGRAHYHVPLLLSAFGYSTYRGT